MIMYVYPLLTKFDVRARVSSSSPFLYTLMELFEIYLLTYLPTRIHS